MQMWNLKVPRKNLEHKKEGGSNMAKQHNQRANEPNRSPSAALPESLKSEVTKKANELIETVLKPQNLKPPPEEPMYNYIEDI